MRRLFAVVASAVLVAGAGVAAASGPSDAVDGCYGAASSAPDPRFALPCKLADGVVHQSGADCRIADSADNACSAVDGRDVSDTELQAYRASWVHRALQLQLGLSSHAPLIEDQLPHTHNSFNASAYAIPRDGSMPSYYPTLTNQDPNQVYSIAAQLDMDVRVIEIDLHWVPSPYAARDGSTHGYWVTLCHGDGQQVPRADTYVHVGCSADRPAEDGFAEVRRWIDAHPDQFVLIYLENQLFPQEPVASREQAHQVAGALLDQYFGKIAYRPSGPAVGAGEKQCATIPYSTSRAQMQASGAHVLLLGNCGLDGWNFLVFDRGQPWDESGDPASYDGSDCARDQQARAADTKFRRLFEDSTFVSAATGAPHPLMTPANVRDMVRCGVNIIGFDQLRPQDGRLAALVWSWAQDEPRVGGGACAQQGADGRFRAAGCEQRLPAACRDAAGGWHVTAASVPWRGAAEECSTEFPGSSFAVPYNGFRNAQLQAAKPAGAPAVWLDYAQVRGAWTPDTATADGAGAGHPVRGHHYGKGHGTGRPAH